MVLVLLLIVEWLWLFFVCTEEQEDVKYCEAAAATREMRGSRNFARESRREEVQTPIFVLVSLVRLL